jgi:RND family efflux transporter MFP subunit
MVEPDLEKLRIEKSVLRPGARKRRRLVWLSLSAAVLAALVILYRLGVLSPALEVQSTAVQNVYPSQSLTLLNASGYVVADRKAAVASKVTGRLVYLGVEEGSRVLAGDVIARLENQDALAARDRARENVTAARYTLAQAAAERDNAALDYERKKTLVANGTIARSLFDAAEARYKSAAAAADSLAAGLRAAKAALEEADVLLDYTNLRAPFDAVVLTKNADVGDIVTPLAATADAKAAVVTIADMGSLLVEVDVSESNITKVRPGQPCEIRLDAFGEERFPGKVHMILPTADRSKASITVKVAFARTDPRVLPEMSAKVAFLSREIRAEEQHPLPAVAASAMVRRNGREVLFLIENGQAREAPAEPGKRLGEMVELKQGPPVGSRVVLAPNNKLKDGSRVAVAQL